MTIDGVSLGVGSFALLVFAFPWMRMRFRGPGTIHLASVHLNRRWDRADREAESDRKAQAVNEVLRCLHQSGSNAIDPQLLEDIGAHLEAEAQRASRVVPGAHTSWLMVLALAEALQFIALPFAPVVGWDDSMIPKIFRYGLPQHYANRYMEFVLWIVLSPVLVVVFLSHLASGLGLFAWVAKRICSKNAWVHMALSKGACLVTQFGVGLYISAQELLQEFGSLFMFATLLMVFHCPQWSEDFASLQFKSDVRCWQSTHFMYIALSLLQLIFQFCTVCWNNLPLYTFFRKCKLKTPSGAAMDRGIEKCFQKDDHLTFLTQADLHDPAILADVDLSVFDFDRPMFSSTWLAFSASLKFMLAACFVFLGDTNGCRWLLLALAILCYTTLLWLNLFIAPCTMHWINCVRSVSLVAGLWTAVCGFAVAGSGPRSCIVAIFAIGLVIIAVAVLLAMLVYGFHSFKAYCSASAVLRENLLNSYQRMVVLFRLLMVRVTPEGVIVGGGERSGVYTIKGLEVAKPSGALFQRSLRRLRADVEDWTDWADWDALVCPVACCPCLPWFPLALPENNSRCDMQKEQIEEHQHMEPSPKSLIGASTNKVEKWMESADLVVDLDRDVELGLNNPPDGQFMIGDRTPNSTGIGPNSFDLFYSTPASDINGGNSDAGCPSAALYRSSPWLLNLKPRTSRSEDEGPSRGHLNVCALQTIERVYNRNEPQVPKPQTYERMERPRSSAFDTGDDHENG